MMFRNKLHLTKKSKSRIILISIGLVLVLFLVLGLVLKHDYQEHLKPVSSSQKAQLVTIPVGSSTQQIGEILHKAGVIRASWAFEWYVRNKDLRDKLQAGTYSLTPNQNVEEIVTILTQGKIATSLFTIYPSKRIDQIKQSMINEGGFNAEEVEKAFNPALYADHPALVDKPAEASLEGYLYPDSFQRISTTKPETIIRASLDEMQKNLTPDIRAGIAKQGLTVHQGVILASIIEREVDNPNDKPIVAQVFLKRYREGMMLGSDVTALYGSIVAGLEPSLTYDSPYNTLIHTGLPPGPISNVTASSLLAVAHPASTDYLYFVSGDDGVTYFSHTEAEHEAAAAAHCHKKCGH